MRILHLDTGRELRGGQRQLLLLAEGLRARGHEQMILARSGGLLESEIRRRGFSTLALGPAAVATEARRAELLHAHDARSHTWAALAAPDRPLVVSRRVAFPVGTGALSRWKYQRAARFLAVSEFVRGELLKAGIPADKITVVYDGVPLRDGPPAAGRLVVAPATGDPQKGSDLAVEACRAAGVDLAFSRALDHDLPRAALFLYLTYSEGLGSAILLAMASGVPVVASSVGGIPEMIEHERTGLLVDNSVQAIVAAIRRTFDDPPAAARRADAARVEVRARFSDAMMVARTEQAYVAALS